MRRQEQVKRERELLVKEPLPVLQALAIDQRKGRMRQRHARGDVVLVQRRDEPIVQPRHRDLAALQLSDDPCASLAVFVDAEVLAVRLVLHDDVAAVPV